MATLTSICEDMFKRKHRDEYPKIKYTQNEKDNFLSLNARNFNKMLKALMIDKYKQYLQDKNNNGYIFSDKDVPFITEVLERFKERGLLEFRRGNMDKVPDRTKVWLVEGFYTMFHNVNTPSAVLEEIGIAMSNRTDYGQVKRFCDFTDVSYSLKELSSRVFMPKWMTNLGPDESCVWMKAFQEDALLFRKKWARIHSIMGEIRQAELDECNKALGRMTDADEFRAALEFEYCEEINQAVQNDKKVKELQRKIAEAEFQRTGDDLERIEYISKMHQRLSDRRIEIEDKIYKSHLKDVELPPERNLVFDDDFKEMVSPEELLRKAIMDYREEMEQFQLVPQISDLPDIDIDKVIVKFRMEQDLKKPK